MKRRQFLSGLIGMPLMPALTRLFPNRLPNSFQDFAKGFQGYSSPQVVRRFAFGSCAEQSRPQPIWNQIKETSPDVFAFIGDNIYADTTNREEIRAKYETLASLPEFAKFRSNVPIIAMWDDHDFGVNDGGREYPFKAHNKEIMLDFWGEPKNSPRRNREGCYVSYYYGPRPFRLQVIMMDLRWFRSPLLYGTKGEYAPNFDPEATILGADQWQWLESELRKPADFRILVSTIQMVSSDHHWEKWANFPLDKARLMALIDREKIDNLVVVSGDMHFAELSVEKTPAGFSLYDLTSSGLNITESASAIANSKRLLLFDQGHNFGLVSIDWSARPRRVLLEVRNASGVAVIQKELHFPV